MKLYVQITKINKGSRIPVIVNTIVFISQEDFKNQSKVTLEVTEMFVKTYTNCRLISYKVLEIMDEIPQVFDDPQTFYASFDVYAPDKPFVDVIKDTYMVKGYIVG